MKVKDKTKKQLLEEMEVLHKQLVKLKKAETERKRAEEALKERQETINAIIETSQDWIWAIDRHGVHTYSNPAIERILGYGTEQIVGRSSLDLLHEDDKKMVEPILRECEEKRCGWNNLLLRWRHKDGTYRYLESNAVPILNTNGDLVGFRGVDRDITEHKEAEEKLRESEKKYRTVVEISPDGIAIASKGHHVFANQSLARIFALSDPDELLGKPVMDYIHPDYREIVRERIETASKGGTSAPLIEEKMIRADGTVVQTEVAAAPLEYQGEEAVLAIIRDITERKQAEEALGQSEERYRTILEDIEEGYFETDLAGRSTFINDSLCKIYGYPRDEFLGIDNRRFTDKENAKRVFEAFNQVYRTGEPGRLFDYEIIRKDGTKRQVEVFPSLRKDLSGNPIGFRGITRDVTERKRAEAQIRESQQRFQDLVETLSDWIWEVDQNGIYTYVSPKIRDLLGYEPQEVLGKTPFDLMPPEEAERVKSAFERLLAAQQPVVALENTNRRKDGRLVVFETSGAPFFDAAGQLVGYRGVDRDITERKQAEEKMESLQEQLRQSQKMEAVGRLAGGIAHDFNNLLTVIKGYSQLSLIELEEDAPLKGNIEQIHRATDRATDLVRQLLAFSRRQILEMKVLDLNVILRSLHNMLRRVIGEDIELITVLAEDLGRIRTDPGWIEQAIMNLVVNARDAMASGGKLTIETENVDLDEAYMGSHVLVRSGGYVMLSVSDTGVGITPEIMERLFEPFFSTKEKDKGTGLGLSTVYGIVKQSGGDIRVYSEPGKGATFKIYFPRVNEPLDGLREKVSGDKLLRGRETILLVEDEEDLRKLAAIVLERQGYRVLSARNGDEALLICEQHKDLIHLMLTDVVMPGMNGRELAKRLESSHPEAKVLYMSGYTDHSIVMHGVLVEGVHYIQKPFTVDALAKKVREVLKR